MDQLVTGSLVGPYRIEGVLGAGGMGRVYRAWDTRLDRPVAIKTSDARFTERFAHEARAISALSHPHICTLYDVGPDYLVMELIDGDTLADRLARGPIGLAEALAIATQLADALEAAHEKGIIHRDLKPANIKITASGTVKVLDFGLAKIEKRSPETVTSLTQTGAVVGTSGYMAPEQLQGKPIDKRADIWAFGVVLHEMLTGERPLGSGSSPRPLGAPAAAAERLPPPLQRLLRWCLTENPRDRLRDIGDARLLLEDAAVPRTPETGPSRRAFTSALAATAGATVLGAWGWLRTPASPSTRRTRFTATLPAGARIYRDAVGAPSLALSPDGSALVIAATGVDGHRLYLRRIDQLAAEPLAGTAGAASPFFSPDGRSVGFFADGWLRRVPSEGGAPVDITEARGAPVGATWGLDGRIVFTAGWRSPLQAVPAAGGRAEVIVPLDTDLGEVHMRRPVFLPGGRSVLLDANLDGQTVIQAIDLQSGRRAVLTQGTTPRYAASGHLLLARDTTLLVAPFDADNLALTGPVVPLAEGLASEAGGAQHYAVSLDGTLAYAPGAERHALVLTDLDGRERSVMDEQARFHRPRFAPDGRRLAVAVARGTARSGDDVWIYDVENPGPGARLTFEGGTGPVWAPDGASISFAGEPFWTERQATGLYTKNADGRSEEQRVLPLAEFHRPIAWTSAGLLFELTTNDGEFLIELLAADERRLITRGRNARVSHDGELLAFVADESGRDTVYVTAFGEGAARWQVEEARDPVWGPNGTELYYMVGNRLWAATLDTAAGVRVVSRRVVQDDFAPPVYGDYDVAPDGRTIALVRPVDPVQGREIVVAFDWLNA
jgi:Tol biopolymer transport system component/predicted Ser/Thr protein kinase